MPVRAVASAPKCKLCQSPNRTEIDALLEKRSKGEKDEAGRRFNFEYVKELAEGEYGVKNLTQENVKIHWRKHCEVISQDAETAMAEVRERMLTELPEDATLDQKIAWATRLFEEQVTSRIEAGEDPGLTWDQYIKLLGIQNQRRQHDEQAALFKSIGAGIAGAFTQLAGKGQPGQLPPADVEGELAAIEDGEVEE